MELNSFFGRKMINEIYAEFLSTTASKATGMGFMCFRSPSLKILVPSAKIAIFFCFSLRLLEVTPDAKERITLIHVSTNVRASLSKLHLVTAFTKLTSSSSRSKSKIFLQNNMSSKALSRKIVLNSLRGAAILRTVERTTYAEWIQIFPS